jgi:hypothetical protein
MTERVTGPVNVSFTYGELMSMEEALEFLDNKVGPDP